MSDDHHIERPAEERFNLTKMGILPFGILIAGGVLTLGSMVLWALDVVHFAYAWLWAFMFLFTICSGAMFWTLLHHAVDANWSVVVRRLLEHIFSLFPYLAIAFIPLAITIATGDLLKWWDLQVGEDVVVDAKRWYLNYPFFWFRIILYFGFFITCGYFLRKWSIQQDESGDLSYSLRMRKLAYGGIIGFALALTFSAVDWIMGLNEHWFSTMWGVYIFAGSAGASLAVIILISHLLQAAGYMKSLLNEEHYHIMGKLLFAFTVFWAYIAFSQYMLYYYANIPEETIWFHHRNTGTWYYASLFLVFGRFFLPFLWLLTQPAKRNRFRLCLASG
jgi:MFS family permease